MSLLDPVFVRELEHLRLEVRRRVAGLQGGAHRSLRRGASVEFAEHRGYAPGDDLRRVDWNAFARLGELVLRLFVADEDVTVHLLVDASRSMAFGSPAKLDTARRLAAALGYLALAGSERVALTVTAGGATVAHAPLRGRRRIPELLATLERVEAAGVATVPRAVEGVLARARGAGIAVVLSDLLDEGASLAAAYRLAVARHETSIVHVLSAEELVPDVDGELTLVDGETGGALDLLGDDEARALYARRLAVWLGELEAGARRRGIRYVQAFPGRRPFGVVAEVLAGRGAWSS